MDLANARQGMELRARYERLYDVLCGKHPHRRPWHFQWLSTRPLYAALREVLPGLGGAVLDAGCGRKPYRHWFGAVSEYVGLDVAAGDEVDIVVPPGAPWPVADAHFDVVLSSQVLMYVPDVRAACAEIERVLKPGGVAVVSFGFIFQEHNPYDLRRLSGIAASQLFTSCETVRLERLGAIGSTLGTLLLNWVEYSVNRSYPTKALRAVLLPVWILFSALVNAACRLLDVVDGTKSFYANVLVVARKPQGRAERE